MFQLPYYVCIQIKGFGFARVAFLSSTAFTASVIISISQESLWQHLQLTVSGIKGNIFIFSGDPTKSFGWYIIFHAFLHNYSKLTFETTAIINYFLMLRDASKLIQAVQWESSNFKFELYGNTLRVEVDIRLNYQTSISDPCGNSDHSLISKNMIILEFPHSAPFGSAN